MEIVPDMQMIRVETPHDVKTRALVPLSVCSTSRGEEPMSSSMIIQSNLEIKRI